MSGVWLASYLVLWLVVLVLAFLLAGSLRQLGLIQLRLGDDPGALITDSGLERGAQAPEFIAADSETGEPVSLSSCRPCRDCSSSPRPAVSRAAS